jgi:hypothetical protein
MKFAPAPSNFTPEQKAEYSAKNQQFYMDSLKNRGQGSNTAVPIKGNPNPTRSARTLAAERIGARPAKPGIMPVQGQPLSGPGGPERNSNGNLVPQSMINGAQSGQATNVRGPSQMPAGMTTPNSTKMKKGGKVSSASSRGDGCAIRGKTKGKMV